MRIHVAFFKQGTSFPEAVAVADEYSLDDDPDLLFRKLDPLISLYGEDAKAADLFRIVTIDLGEGADRKIKEYFDRPKMSAWSICEMDKIME